MIFMTPISSLLERKKSLLPICIHTLFYFFWCFSDRGNNLQAEKLPDCGGNRTRDLWFASQTHTIGTNKILFAWNEWKLQTFDRHPLTFFPVWLWQFIEKSDCKQQGRSQNFQRGGAEESELGIAYTHWICHFVIIRHLKIDVYVKHQTASEVFDFTTLL